METQAALKRAMILYGVVIAFVSATAGAFTGGMATQRIASDLASDVRDHDTRLDHHADELVDLRLAATRDRETIGRWREQDQEYQRMAMQKFGGIEAKLNILLREAASQETGAAGVVHGNR